MKETFRANPNKLIVLNNNITNLEVLKNSLNKSTKCLIYDKNIRDIDILNNVHELVSHIGFIYHNDGGNYPTDFNNNIENMFDPELVIKNLNQKHHLKYDHIISSRFIELLLKIKDKSKDIIIDLITCEINDNIFIEAINNLKKEYGLNIRYSVDKTGNNPQGNWILESHNINIENLYFNENIKKWNHLLLELPNPKNINNLKLNYDENTKTYRMTEDIILNINNDDWIKLEPGCIFDGNNHTIDFNNVERSVGLFYINGNESNITTIKNLKLKNFKTTQLNGILVKSNSKHLILDNIIIEGNIETDYSCGIGYNINNCKLNNSSFIGNVLSNYSAGFFSTGNNISLDNCVIETSLIKGYQSAGFISTCNISSSKSQYIEKCRNLNETIIEGEMNGLICSAMCFYNSREPQFLNRNYVKVTYINSSNSGGIIGWHNALWGSIIKVTNCIGEGRFINSNNCGLVCSPYNGSFKASELYVDSCFAIFNKDSVNSQSINGITGYLTGYWGGGKGYISNCYSTGDMTNLKTSAGISLISNKSDSTDYLEIKNCYSDVIIDENSNTSTIAYGYRSENFLMSNNYSKFYDFINQDINGNNVNSISGAYGGNHNITKLLGKLDNLSSDKWVVVPNSYPIIKEINNENIINNYSIYNEEFYPIPLKMIGPVNLETKLIDELNSTHVLKILLNSKDYLGEIFEVSYDDIILTFLKSEIINSNLELELNDIENKLYTITIKNLDNTNILNEESFKIDLNYNINDLVTIELLEMINYNLDSNNSLYKMKISLRKNIKTIYSYININVDDDIYKYNVGDELVFEHTLNLVNNLDNIEFKFQLMDENNYKISQLQTVTVENILKKLQVDKGLLFKSNFNNDRIEDIKFNKDAGYTINTSNDTPNNIGKSIVSPIDSTIYYLDPNIFTDFTESHSELTFSSWIKFTNTSRKGIFIVHGHTGIQIHGTNMRFNLSDNFWGENSNTNLPTNEWVHILVTTDGKKRYYYVNGILSEIRNSTSTGKLYNGSNYMTLLGTYYPFKGLAYDMRIYNRYINSEEVKIIKNSENLNIFNIPENFEINVNNISDEFELSIFNQYLLNKPNIKVNQNGLYGNIYLKNNKIVFKFKNNNNSGLDGISDSFTITLMDERLIEKQINLVIKYGDFNSLILGSNLLFGLDDSTLNYSIDEEINEWKNITGDSNYDFNISQNGVLPKVVDIEGKKMARFNNADLRMVRNLTYQGEYDYTVMLVARIVPGNWLNRVLSASDQNWLHGFHRDGMGLYFKERVNNDRGWGGHNNFHVLTSTKTQSDIKYTKYGEILKQSNVYGYPMPTQFVLGGGGTFNERSVCDVAALYVWKRVLTDEEIRKYEGFLANKYSLNPQQFKFTNINPPEIITNNIKQNIDLNEPFNDNIIYGLDDTGRKLEITKLGEVDNTKSGSYSVTYKTIDSSGNETEISLTYNVSNNKYINPDIIQDTVQDTIQDINYLINVGFTDNEIDNISNININNNNIIENIKLVPDNWSDNKTIEEINNTRHKIINIIFRNNQETNLFHINSDLILLDNYIEDGTQVDILRSNLTVSKDLVDSKPVYINLYNLNDFTTITSNNEELTITKTENAYSVDGEEYMENENVGLFGLNITFGGVLINGKILDEALTFGDPHIKTLTNKVFELPKYVGAFRMLQGDNLIINTKTRKINMNEKREISFLSNNYDKNGCYYENIYIKSENNIFMLNFESKETNKYNDYFKFNKNILSFKHSKYGTIKLSILNIKNILMKHSFKLKIKYEKSLSGLLVNEYLVESMKVSNLYNDKIKKGQLGKNYVFSKLFV